MVGNLFSPVQASDAINDKVKTEVQRLNLKLAPPRRALGAVPLTDDADYNRYARVTGQITKQILDNLVNTDAYKEASDYEKEQLLRETVQKTRKQSSKLMKEQLTKEAGME